MICSKTWRIFVSQKCNENMLSLSGEILPRLILCNYVRVCLGAPHLSIKKAECFLCYCLSYLLVLYCVFSSLSLVSMVLPHFLLQWLRSNLSYTMEGISSHTKSGNALDFFWLLILVTTSVSNKIMTIPCLFSVVVVSWGEFWIWTSFILSFQLKRHHLRFPVMWLWQCSSISCLYI